MADMTPCMSPLPHQGHLLDKPGEELTKDKAESNGDRKLIGKERI